MKEPLQSGISTKDHSSFKWLISLLDREWHESQINYCDSDSPLICHHIEVGIPLKSSQKFIKF